MSKVIRLSRIQTALENAPGPLRPFANWILDQRREHNRIYLHCFEPSDIDKRAVRGEITVRGSCFTLRPDDYVEITAGSLPATRAKPVLNRRDERLPNVAPGKTGHSDFVTRIEVSELRGGMQRVRLRLVSGGKTIRRVSTRIYVDHKLGISSEYERWIADFEVPARDCLKQEFAKFTYRPSFAVHGDVAALGKQSYGSAASSDAEYVCSIRTGITLDEDALGLVVRALNQDREIDFLYGDDDEIDASGRRSNPFFKPSWSPELALSFNYIGGFFIARSELFAAGQPLNRAKKIHRIPHILSHRSPLSGAAPFASEGVHVEPGRVAGTWRPRYKIPETTSLSIIVGSGGGVDVLNANLRSLFAMNSFADFELIVNDNSRSDQIREYLEREWKNDSRVRWMDSRGQAFNYSTLNNYAVSQCSSDMLLFLNDDTSAVEPDWITAMLELAVRPEVGAVGAKLLYPNGLIQHAGVVMGIFENCGHAFKGLSGSSPHYFGLSDVIRDVSAVTAACLMTRRGVFEQVGGFDEKAFAVAFNDVDLCLKIGAAGYRILYTPFAVLYHHEAFSKPAEDLHPATVEIAAMGSKWRDLIAEDPFYNPNLTRRSEDYSLRKRLPR